LYSGSRENVNYGWLSHKVVIVLFVVMNRDDKDKDINASCLFVVDEFMFT
jgi:hypothetical protein